MTETTVRIMCPSLVCRKVLAVPTSARGKTVRCRGCGTSIRVPEAPKETKPAPKPEPEHASKAFFSRPGQDK